MLKFLKKPYPFNDDLRHNAKIIFFISLSVLAFLIVFQPIEISSLTKSEIFYLFAGLVAATFISLTINLTIFPSLLPGIFDSNKWNVGKEIIWNIWILLTISGSDFLFYSKLFGIMNIHFSDIIRIFLLALIPVSILITINQDRLLRNHLRSAQKMNKKLMESKQLKDKLVNFDSEYKKDDLIIRSDSVIVIRSADNYIEVFYKSGNEVKRQLIRSSLKKAEEKLEEFEFIVKCHRSYIVNVNHIKEVEGNTQGYKLYFDNIDIPVIVSQKYINTFKRLI